METVSAVMVFEKKKALGQEMDRKVGGKQHELWIVSPDKVNK